MRLNLNDRRFNLIIQRFYSRKRNGCYNFYPHYKQISTDLLKDFNAQKLTDGLAPPTQNSLQYKLLSLLRHHRVNIQRSLYFPCQRQRGLFFSLNDEYLLQFTFAVGGFDPFQKPLAVSMSRVPPYRLYFAINRNLFAEYFDLLFLVQNSPTKRTLNLITDE